MKPIKLFLIAIAIGVMTASAGFAQTHMAPTRSSFRTSSASGTWHGDWHHHHHCFPRTSVFFDVGFGYPFGFGYPYYGYGYPYGYGYYGAAAPVAYGAGSVGVNGSIVVEVQRRLARAGYYRGAIDGVAGSGTRRAIRSYERAHGLPVDGQIDRQLLRTMGLA